MGGGGGVPEGRGDRTGGRLALSVPPSPPQSVGQRQKPGFIKDPSVTGAGATTGDAAWAAWHSVQGWEAARSGCSGSFGGPSSSR